MGGSFTSPRTLREGFDNHASHLLVSTSQRTASHWGGFRVYGENGGTHGFPGTLHCLAEVEQLSTCPLGALQSLTWELSQVPEGGGQNKAVQMGIFEPSLEDHLGPV